MNRAAQTASAVLMIAAALAGCGGGGDDREPQQLVDQTTNVDRTIPVTQQSSGYFETITGPLFTVPASRGFTRACVDLQWTQQVTKAVGVSVWVKPTQPIDSAPATSTAAATGAGQVVVAQQRCVDYRATSTLSAALEVQARISSDCGCLDALRDYSIRVRWTATFYPD